MLEKFGGSEKTEQAVKSALDWIVRHQLDSGGWSFDHRLANHANGENPGTLKEARNAPTGMALMALLGAGHTHQHGDYKIAVEKALKFLTKRMKPGGSLHEAGGSMYAHGIASIALCEAFAMTQDEAIKAPAQSTLDFIVAAQDRVGGGWRYEPGQPGDTSVLGWQLGALMAGQRAKLTVPESAIKGAQNFLDIVQSEDGAKYGYTGPGAGAGTTAIGLLSRMHLGWTKDNPPLQKGVDLLSQLGPSKSEIYYNYYAAQKMFHTQGEGWKRWNQDLLKRLPPQQVQDGDEKGSWHFFGGFGDAGGRHYHTCLCALLLETYYRHDPIDGAKDDKS